MKWGLFGGTFDPVHFGHLRCAEEVLEMFNLNRVFFVPAATPPHKIAAEITPFKHREEMVKLAIGSNNHFSFSDIENRKDEKSYSVTTVADMKSRFPKKMELYFILGQDAFHAITTWKDWEQLLTMCNFVVMTRPNYENKGFQEILPEAYARRFAYDEETDGFVGEAGNTIYFRGVTFLDISSSDIRRRVQAGQSISYLVPKDVRQYILQQGIYA
ncbi:MAG: nicotinate-nucleotide adenylyltransferase [Deltaproteobacteria bacterium]|nr:nicotinate-nucleotide adenylyltransferase [Deltaproteobacteria bacterium]